MIKRQFPSVSQVNAAFFITAVLTLISSIVFRPRLGLGTNLWINEYVYLLFAPLLLAFLNSWPLEDVYRLKEAPRLSLLLSIPAAICVWPFAAYASRGTKILLDRYVGEMPAGGDLVTSVYQSFILVIGMIILAPICEEIFFRGMVQTAYEKYMGKRAFLVVGLIFGAYHVLNGVSEIIPTSVLGIAMGYLAQETDSLAPSMIFHATANILAVFFGGYLESLASIPTWMHIAATGALVLGILILRAVPRKKPLNEPSMQKEPLPAVGTALLVLSFLYLIGVGVWEITIRLN